MKIKSHFFLITILIVSVFANAGNIEPKQNLSILDGLSHNGVTSILEDSKGYIWVATFDGLNRYDGYGFKIFKNSVEQNLLLTNRIRIIKEDNFGNIWIGTDEGLSILNLATEKFKNVYSNKTIGKGSNGPIILQILFDQNNEKALCLTESDGIIVFNSSFSFSSQYKLNTDKNKEAIKLLNGIQLDTNNFLICSSEGLILFNIGSGKFTKVLASSITSCNSICKIAGNSYLTTSATGLYIFDLIKQKNTFQFKVIKEDFKNLNINSSSIDNNGNLWLTTLRDGLLIIPKVKSYFNNKATNISTFKSSTGLMRLSCIASSTKRGCWVGSFDRGIFRFDITENPFKYCHSDLHQVNGLESNEIMSITPYDDNRVLLSTIRGNLTFLNTKSNLFEKLPFSIERPASASTLKSFLQDSHKNIWFKNIGSDGLYILKAGTNKVTKINVDPEYKQYEMNPRYATEDKHGNIWLATTSDVLKLNINKETEITSVESLNNNPLFKTTKLHLVRYVYADPSYDYIWAGTDFDGLIRIELKPNTALNKLKAEKFTHDNNNKLSISSDFVTSIVRLPNREMWIGTERGGICKVINSDKNPQFICFSEKDGLSNNVVKRVIYDNKYNLWITTNIGLNKFNTKTNKFRNFRKHEGLAFEDFTFSGRMIPNGTIVVGGMNGLTYFDPQNISSNEALPDLAFGELKIYNKTIAPGDTLNDRVVYKKHLLDKDLLELKYNEAIFSIELQSLHYSTPENHLIKYQLLPINPEWVEIPSSQRTINYSGLQPGNYTLKVMASNSLNQWTAPIELFINIKPPFWKTWPAYLIYFILISSIIYVVFFIILRIYTLNHNLELEKLEKDKIKEVNAAKINVFANISHEIKTPLTLISGPLKLLSERFQGNSDISNKLNMVHRQSKKLAQLVDQMHEFQLDDANQLKMKYSKFSFNDFIAETLSDFAFMAETENKKLELIGETTEIKVMADRDKLEKIINNLLNNALKYTKEKDSIIVKYLHSNLELIISVTDTGHGIDDDDLPHIFERFYQAKDKNRATVGGYGIGLTFTKRLVMMHNGNINVESEIGEGSCFTVHLPIITEQIDENTENKIQQILIEESKFKNETQEQKNSFYKITNFEHKSKFPDATVYVVEDNKEIQQFIVDVLSNYFKIKAYDNGLACINAMQEIWPDLVVSDVLMPEMNGLELCSRIKTDIKTSHIPVILLTAFDSIQDQIKGISEGADAYITKPFDAQHLVTQIESLLLNRQQLRERFQIDIPLSFSNETSTCLDNEFLENLYKLMSENLDNQDLEIDSFAKLLYLNRSYFYQKVKALTNQTPFELLKIYRLKRAAELLVQKEVSVNDVYLMTGFKSRTHFSKLFKEVYNVTPGKYADQIAEKYKNEK